MNLYIVIIVILQLGSLVRSLGPDKAFPEKSYYISENGPQRQLFQYLTSGASNAFWTNLVSDYEKRKLSISEGCDNSIRRTIDAIENGTLWAYRLVDAAGRSPPGLLDGTFASLGDYDQCLSVTVNRDKNESAFEGQYCMLRLRPRPEIILGDPTLYGFVDLKVADNDQHVFERVARFSSTPEYYSYHNGFCTPSACTVEDVTALMSEFLSTSSWELDKVQTCNTETTKRFRLSNLTSTQKLAFLFLATFVVLVISSTLVETFGIWLPFIPDSLLLCFSAVTNVKQLFTRTEADNKRVRIADYCRLTIIFIEIIIHANCFSGLFKAVYLLSRLDYLSITATKLINQGFTSNAPNESLFFLGGATAAMSLMPLLKKANVPLECVKSILKRWFRLAPVLLCCIALQMLMPYVTSGPAYDEMMQLQSEACQKYWWHNILFFNHFTHPDNMCMPYTWSMGAEFHLFALAALNVALIYKWKRVGVLFTLGTIVCGMILPAMYTHYNNFAPFILFPVNLAALEESFRYLYLSTSSHLTSYFMMFFVFYLKFSGFPSTFDKKTRRRVTLILALLSFQVTLWNVPWNVLNASRNRFIFFMYVFSFRFLFTLLPVWLCFISRDVDRLFHNVKDANANNVDEQATNSQTTNSEQTTKSEQTTAVKSQTRKKYPLILLVLTRLAGSIYLMHSFFIYWDQLSTRQLLPFNEYGMFKRAFSAQIGAFGLGLVFYVFFDAPIANLRNLFIGKISAKKHSEKQD